MKIILSGLHIIVGIYNQYPHMESASKIKELQYMCGVKPYKYWITMYIFDLAWYIVCIVIIGLVLAIFSSLTDTTVLSGGDELCEEKTN